MRGFIQSVDDGLRYEWAYTSHLVGQRFCNCKLLARFASCLYEMCKVIPRTPEPIIHLLGDVEFSNTFETNIFQKSIHS
jgi:hypothetical protein